MKLERTLIELEMLVDYGTRYLLDVNSAYEDGVECGRDMVADLSIWEFCDLNDLSNRDILDNMDGDDIERWVKSSFRVGDLFDGDDIRDYVAENYDIDDVYDDYYIEEYCRDHYSVDDIFGEESIVEYVANNIDADSVYDVDDILNCVSGSKILDYISNNFAVADLVQWRDDALC